MNVPLTPSLFALPFLLATASVAAQPIPKPAAVSTQRPLSFVENRGQWDSPADFIVQHGPLTAHFAGATWTLDLRGDDEDAGACAVRLHFEGARDDVRAAGERPLPGRYNFFRGTDPEAWQTGVRSWHSVLYSSMYEGVDVRVRSQDGQLEYDLLLEPGANLETVVVRCEGIDALAIDDDGALVLDTAVGPIRQDPPTTWELDRQGERRFVACRYRRIDDERYGFVVPRRDDSRALVVDPGLVWSTFLGGSLWDGVGDMGRQPDGDLVLVGMTKSIDFPVKAGYQLNYSGGIQDGYIACLSPDGSVLRWASYLGGSANDWCLAVAVDPSSGQVVVGGSTGSVADFPVTSGAMQSVAGGKSEAFLSRLSEDGSALLYSTFYGGGEKDGAWDLALEATGAVAVVGMTWSTDLPLGASPFQSVNRLGPQDGFVARMTAPASGSGRLLAATYLGGTAREAQENRMLGVADTSGIHVAVDVAGTVTVSGETESADFPVTQNVYDSTHNGGKDLFVTRFDPMLTRQLASTFVGSTLEERRGALALDPAGRPVLAGMTRSARFPTTAGAFQTAPAGLADGVVLKLDTALQTLLYSTYVGGPRGDHLLGVLVDDSGTVTAVGQVESGFPITSGAYDTTNSGIDAVLVRLRMDGNGSRDLLYSTFLGAYTGPANDYQFGWRCLQRGHTVTMSGFTGSANFAVTPGAYDTSHNGEVDAFVSQIEMLPTGVEPYGTSSAGCKGQLYAGVTEQPRIDRPDFALTCSGGPANGGGALLLGVQRPPQPVPVLGIDLWVLPTVAPAASSDAFGYANVRLPLPNDPRLVGAKLYAQFVWASPCGAQGLSASDALEITVQ